MLFYVWHRHSRFLTSKAKILFLATNLPPPLNFPNFWVTIWGWGSKISAYHINMRGDDRPRICFFVFAGSKKCTRNSTDCPRCLRVLAMVLNVVILSVAKDLLPVNTKTMSPTSSLRVGFCSTWQSLLRSVSCWAARSISSLVGFEGILRYTQNDSAECHC